MKHQNRKSYSSEFNQRPFEETQHLIVRSDWSEEFRETVYIFVLSYNRRVICNLHKIQPYNILVNFRKIIGWNKLMKLEGSKRNLVVHSWRHHVKLALRLVIDDYLLVVVFKVKHNTHPLIYQTTLASSLWRKISHKQIPCVCNKSYQRWIYEPSTTFAKLAMSSNSMLASKEVFFNPACDVSTWLDSWSVEGCE